MRACPYVRDAKSGDPGHERLSRTPLEGVPDDNLPRDASSERSPMSLSASEWRRLPKRDHEGTQR